MTTGNLALLSPKEYRFCRGYRRPCKHVGAVLLVFKHKQELEDNEDVKARCLQR